ncbi:MAG: hypothetical protein AseanaTS_21850 [Candidatus Pelagadaptatus aseana]
MNSLKQIVSTLKLYAAKSAREYSGYLAEKKKTRIPENRMPEIPSSSEVI